jgi:hypothetical protein
MKHFRVISIVGLLFFAQYSFVFSQQSFVQPVYKTQKGMVKITVVVNDTTYSFTSNELRTTLIRETMEIEMRLDLATLNFGVDSLKEYINEMPDKVVVYKGKLKGSFSAESNTSRPPSRTKVVGKLYMGDTKKQIIFFANMEQVSKDGGIVSAILTGNFTIPVKDFHIERYVSGISDVIAVDFKQDLF